MKAKRGDFKYIVEADGEGWWTATVYKHEGWVLGWITQTIICKRREQEVKNAAISYIEAMKKPRKVYYV